jgi:hypothetical protein
MSKITGHPRSQDTTCAAKCPQGSAQSVGHKGRLPMGFQWSLVPAIFFATVALAQMDMTTGKGAKLRPSQFAQDMDVSMKLMDRDMSAAPMDGNADHDFAAMMIPHHQGAIDMAKAELSYGRDPALRRLAEEIIVDQKSEIDLMNLWLKKHPETGKELCR